MRGWGAGPGDLGVGPRGGAAKGEPMGSLHKGLGVVPDDLGAGLGEGGRGLGEGQWGEAMMSLGWSQMAWG